MEISIELSQIIFAMMNFLVLYLILRFKLFEPVTNFINKRTEKIRNSIEMAKKDREEASKLKEENQRLLAESRNEGKVIVEEYKLKAERVYDEIVNEANKEVEIKMQRAKVDIVREKEKAQQELKEQVIDLSIMLSEKVLEEHIDEKEHRRLIDDFIAKVGI